MGPFSRVAPAAGRTSTAGSTGSTGSLPIARAPLDTSRLSFGVGGGGSTTPRAANIPPDTQRGPGTDPFIKVTAVGSAKQRRCDYFGELRELHWPDSHK